METPQRNKRELWWRMTNACDAGERFLQRLWWAFTLHEVCQEVAALSTIPVAHCLWLSKTCLFLLQIQQQRAQHSPEWCSTLTFCFSLSIFLCIRPLLFSVLPLFVCLWKVPSCLKAWVSKGLTGHTRTNTHPPYNTLQCASNMCVALLQLVQSQEDDLSPLVHEHEHVQ